jgi:hypothetical protein
MFSPNDLSSYLTIGAVLFVLGLFTVLTRRNAISVLMGVELILNSANINYVAFSHFSVASERPNLCDLLVHAGGSGSGGRLGHCSGDLQIFHIDIEAGDAEGVKTCS